MYTSYIGKKFLKLYNEQEGTNLSGEQFFKEIQFPVFFDSDKHLMHVHGSTFFQSISDEKIKESGTEPLARLKRLHDDISNGKVSASTYVGYAAGEVTAVTSGQLSSLDLEISAEEMYLSWIGQGFAIGVNGGLLFVDNEKILQLLFRGWNLYRRYLDQTPNLKPRQIETWNGQWLLFCSQFKSHDLIDENRFQLDIGGGDNEKKVKSITTIPWIKVIFSFCKILDNRSFTAQAFVLSKTNTTYGFINIYLPEISKMYELRDKFFMDSESILKEEEIETLSTFYSFNDACKMGSIGLKAIEPDKLREYMPIGTYPYSKGNEYKFSDAESIKKYQLFKIWIIAMLNKTELLNMASEIAQVLVNIEKGSKETKRGKTSEEQDNKKIFETRSIKLFIEELTVVMQKAPKDSPLIRETVKEILKMPYDLFPLFVTLIKFEYNYKITTN